MIVLPGGYEKTFGDLDGFELDTNQLFSQYKVIKKKKLIYLENIKTY